MNTGLIILIFAVVVAIILVVACGIVAWRIDKASVFVLAGFMALFILIFGGLAYINLGYSETNKKHYEGLKNALETSAEEMTSSSIESVDCEKCNKKYNIEYKFCPECGAELK